MDSRDQLSDMLRQGVVGLGLDISQEKFHALLDYLMLLDKWNVAYNLSGIKDVKKMVAYHLVDSLAVVPYINGQVMLDVGTGAGLPGIPLAICYPDKEFLLLDSNGKKTRFLFQVKAELALNNLTVFHDRTENFQSPRQIDIVLCRAYAALELVARQTEHLMTENSTLLAMKGQYPQDEIDALPERFRVRQSWQLEVPGIEGSRHLIEIVLAGKK